jgi:AcrR family transcriptional regulator
VNKREQNKEDRRRRILAAAKTMIYDDNFSMRKLADSAGVSVVTAYSLFGSRQNIVASVFEKDLDEFSHELSDRGGDAIERMFSVLPIAGERFQSDPDYFRSMLKTISGGDSALTDLFMLPRMGTWRSLLEDARAEGMLSASANVEALAKAIIHFTVGLFQEWRHGRASVEQMCLEGNYVLALLLVPITAPARSSQLYATSQRLADKLSRSHS